MFIISVEYIAPLEQVDASLEDHVHFLEKQYKQRKFIASGRKIPRTGGVILAKAKDLEEINKIIEQDPFFQRNIAKYEVIEFMPSMTLPEFDSLNEVKGNKHE